MSLAINTNTTAMSTHRSLTYSSNQMAKSIEKLSSGYKINIGADDPSGLVISEQLRSQISGLERAVQNSSEASNLIGIAEGALNEMNTILKKMRALAIHAANNGVTSPEQVAADQTELDSGIETINRIANTTRYSDQYLLNGSKELVYDIHTEINQTTDHSLLNTKSTQVYQIFKRDGVKVSVDFNGTKSEHQADTSVSAQRAYLEADSAYSLSQVSGDSITAKQEFILTGSQGSKSFSFTAGTHLGTVVAGINNVKDSTGIAATLTFASDVRIDKTSNGGTAPVYPNTPATGLDGYNDGTYVYSAGDIQIYGAGLNNEATSKINSVTMTPDAADSFIVGYNCDGDGKIYAKIVDKATGAIEYYKDADCTMLIGTGNADSFTATNNSGIPSSPVQNLDGIFIDLNSDNCDNLDVFEIVVIGQSLNNQKDMNVEGIAGWADLDACVMSGVNLGVNTSSTGGLYFRYSPLTYEADGKTVATFKVEVFTDGSYEPQYLVATSGEVVNNLNIPEGQTVRVESWNDSGLNITMNIPMAGAIQAAIDIALEEARTAGLTVTDLDDLQLALETAEGTFSADFDALGTIAANVQAISGGAHDEFANTHGLTSESSAVIASIVEALKEHIYNGGTADDFKLPDTITDPSNTDYHDLITADSDLFDDLLQEILDEFSSLVGNVPNNVDLYMQLRSTMTSLDTALAKAMPEDLQVGKVSFTNLGMRVYAEDYGSQATLRIQNKTGELFYQYRESDTLDRVMIKADTTVQISGQDARVALNGGAIYTTGLVANTTTPEFSGSLVFNSGMLGATTIAIAGYDVGKLYSKATALQGIEENSNRIQESRRHFEPQSVNVTMGTAADTATNTPSSGLVNSNGTPVNLYVDFSQLDSTVEAKISNFGNADVTFSYDDATQQLTINANDMGNGAVLSVSIKINPENLKNGYYITEDNALKGLYIKSDLLVDLTKSTTYPAQTETIDVQQGDGITNIFTHATNPRSNTKETLGNFQGGMQFQLGNTEGDQDRTVYSIQSMSMSNLGSITYNGVDYCLQDVLGGGVACLSKDPILAMRILEQAVDDVTSLRARLGAFQANMLETNISSLNVAIENITKTESAIRDTDMAEEATQFTRFQIMQQAGTSMLAQANMASQNVLSLLQ